MQPLAGLGFIVTRPAHQARSLCADLTKAGGLPFLFSTLDIRPADDQVALRSCLADLNQFDALIFLSPNAVTHSADLIHTLWPVLPKHLKFFAVGPGTAAALRTANLPAAIVPTEDFSSEGLLALPDLQSIQNQRILLVQGAGSRDLLAQTLTKRSAQVKHAISYQRMKLNPDPAPLLNALRAGQIHAAIITSVESLAQFIHILRPALGKDLQTLPLLVISKRIADYARAQGFKTIILANDASEAAIVQALREIGVIPEFSRS